jgi:hypothetical protein
MSKRESHGGAAAGAARIRQTPNATEITAAPQLNHLEMPAAVRLPRAPADVTALETAYVFIGSSIVMAPSERTWPVACRRKAHWSAFLLSLRSLFLHSLRSASDDLED